MENQESDFDCQEIRNTLKKVIDDIPCEELDFEKMTDILSIDVGKPIPEATAEIYQADLLSYFGNDFQYSFTIQKNEINKIVSENATRDYFHVFFVNEKQGMIDKLNVVFRFSDIRKFKSDTLELYLKNENAYRLNNGLTQKFNASSDSFPDLRSGYLNGIGAVAAAKPNTILTEYITFDMKDVLAFNGFEQDLDFELMCVAKNGMGRLGLQVYITDSDRIHTPSGTHSGYYDLGSLYP